MIQRRHIDRMAEELSTAFGAQDLTGQLAAMEASIARFRSTYWWQHLTAHGPANDLLLAYQEQHRLGARFEQILAETADFNRLAQAQENQQVSAALGIIAILGLPIGTALGALQVLGYQHPWQFLAGTGAALACTAGILTTRYGRLVLRALRAEPLRSTNDG